MELFITKMKQFFFLSVRNGIRDVSPRAKSKKKLVCAVEGCNSASNKKHKSIRQNLRKYSFILYWSQSTLGIDIGYEENYKWSGKFYRCAHPVAHSRIVNTFTANAGGYENRNSTIRLITIFIRMKILLKGYIF